MTAKFVHSISAKILFLFTMFVYDCYCDINEVKLQQHLFSNNPPYHHMARPVKLPTTKIWANFSISISQIVSIDMRNEVVTTSIWPTQEWYDEYMQWDPAEFGGITNTGISPDLIWKPEIVLYNNVDGNFEVEFKSRVLIGYQGNCLWAPPSIFKTHCTINAQHFPYDEQFCPLTFLSFDYDYTQVEIVSKFSEGDYTGDQYWHSSEWSIVSAKTQTYLTSCASCHTNNHSAITVMLHLKRKPLFYSVNLVLPILIVSVLTVMSFYLPSECCEKITLTVTVLLSVTMLLLIVSKMVPKTSYHVPLLNMYLIFILLLVSFSLIGNVCVLNVHFRSSSTHHSINETPRYFILNVLPKFLLMDTFSAKCLENMHGEQETDEKAPAKRTSGYANNLAIAKRLESWHLAISSMDDIQSCYEGTCNHYYPQQWQNQNKPNNNKINKNNNKNNKNNINAVNNSLNNNNNNNHMVLSPNYSNDGPGFPMDPIGEEEDNPLEGLGLDRESGFILNSCVSYIRQNLEDAVDEKMIQEEWKFLALVMDRVLLVIFALITITGSYTIVFSKFYYYTGKQL